MMQARIALLIIGFHSCMACAFAQATLAEAPARPVFMNRYDFHLSMTALGSDDQRFSWDGRIGGNIDVVDYVKGRLSLFAEYDVVLGNEPRSFDPNQGNYTFEGASSLRWRKMEFAGVFHHLSRHLSDRPKVEAVAINSLELRALRHWKVRDFELDMRGGAGKIVQHSFLDYSWRTHVDVIVRHPFNDTVGWFGRASMETFGVDGSIPRRGAQTGAHFESGLRLNGKNGAVEAFAGWERVVDAYPLERTPNRRAFAGFRLTAK